MSLRPERTYVEQPLIETLVALGWTHLPGDAHDLARTGRSSFRQVLLPDRLRAGLRRANPLDDGSEWLDDVRLSRAIGALERLDATGLMEANQQATGLLWDGVTVDGLPGVHHGDAVVRFVNFERPELNDFVVVDQFRVDPPGQGHSISCDLVLFVNGIPLGVVECKSPDVTDPINEAIDQLLRYSNRRTWYPEDEGVERLFHYVQLTVATCRTAALVGTVGMPGERYGPWRDTAPIPVTDVTAELGVEELDPQQIMAAGCLRPIHLLDIVESFTLFDHDRGRLTRKVPRWQQYRAVHALIQRLQRDGLPADARGGVVFGTQGSGKSLTMVHLVRKLRTLDGFASWQVVVVTDRRDLEKQLARTTALTGETPVKTTSSDDLVAELSSGTSKLVFGMIQKYQQAADGDDVAVGDTTVKLPEEPFAVCNTSSDVIVLVDEAHRTHSSTLHANLRRALPNAAMVAFTGTPILVGNRRKTHEIFGPIVDTYNIRQAEHDRATVPILYEGRETGYRLDHPEALDSALQTAYPDAAAEQLSDAKSRYATSTAVLEADQLIKAKAADMLGHYLTTVMPGGFKAQVVAVSRKAAVRYATALRDARDRLVAELDGRRDLDRLRAVDPVALEGRDAVLAAAARHRDLVERLDFAAVISPSHNQDPAFDVWTDPAATDRRIEDFKKPLTVEGADPFDPDATSQLAFLCVKSMLLTGFDAPIEQAMYLDRTMQGPELLQAIARVNRRAAGKTHGLVVDYYGLADSLAAALAVYAADDVATALAPVSDRLPVLESHHQRILDFLADHGIIDLATQAEDALALLEDPRNRARFRVLLTDFLSSLDTVLPRAAALRFVNDARLLGVIAQQARNRLRDPQMSLFGAGRKIGDLIDEHLRAAGISTRIEPLSILDAEFDQHVDAAVSPRAAASEMEHALRYHITVNEPADPTHYQSLADRLEAILEQFAGHWDELAAELQRLIAEIREDEHRARGGQLELPFIRLLEAVDGHPTDTDALPELAADLTGLLREHVRQVDFWRQPQAQQTLRTQIVTWLDEHDLVPYEQLAGYADIIVEMARRHHTRLTDA